MHPRASRLRFGQPTLKATLDRAATILVIVAAIGVITSTWRARRFEPQQPPVDSAAESTPLQAPPQRLDGAPTLGSHAAPAGIIQYSDFECSFCSAFARDTWPSIKREYVDTGKVLVAFRHLPLPTHRYAKAAAISASCAAEQGRFWNMHDLLFVRSHELDEATGHSLAPTLSLDPARFAACLKQHGPRRVSDDLEQAAALGLSGTPTFLVGRFQPNGALAIAHVLVGAHPIEQFRTVLDALLSHAPAAEAHTSTGLR